MAGYQLRIASRRSQLAMVQTHWVRDELAKAHPGLEIAIEAPDDHDTAGADPAGAVFLKGNQHSGTYLVRPESGLGEGILISGHHLDDPSRGDTWGPLPLDLFAQADA